MSSTLNPLDLWYRNAGVWLTRDLKANPAERMGACKYCGTTELPRVKPSKSSPTACLRCCSLNRTYVHATKPDKTIRLTSGTPAFALISLNDQPAVWAYVKAPDPANGAPPPNNRPLRIIPPDRVAEIETFAGAVLDPPEPPFLLILFGKQAITPSQLRLNVSRDVLDVSGPSPLRIDTRAVRRVVERFAGVPIDELRNAIFNRDRRIANPAAKRRSLDWEREFRIKYPEAAAALRDIPPQGADDRTAIDWCIDFLRAKENSNAAC